MASHGRTVSENSKSKSKYAPLAAAEEEELAIAQLKVEIAQLERETGSSDTDDGEDGAEAVQRLSFRTPSRDSVVEVPSEQQVDTTSTRSLRATQSRRARGNAQPWDTTDKRGSSESQRDGTPSPSARGSFKDRLESQRRALSLTRSSSSEQQGKEQATPRRTPGTYSNTPYISTHAAWHSKDWKPFARVMGSREKHAHLDRVKDCYFFDKGPEPDGSRPLGPRKALSCDDMGGLRVWDLSDPEKSRRCIGVVRGKKEAEHRERNCEADGTDAEANAEQTLSKRCTVIDYEEGVGHDDMVRDCVVYRVNSKNLWVDDTEERICTNDKWMAVSCSADKSLKVWTLGQYIVRPAFSSEAGLRPPDPNELLAPINELLEWDSTIMALNFTIPDAHENWVMECSVFAYRPTGHIVVLSCSSDQTMKVWNLNELAAQQHKEQGIVDTSDFESRFCEEQGHVDWVMGCCVYYDEFTAPMHKKKLIELIRKEQTREWTDSDEKKAWRRETEDLESNLISGAESQDLAVRMTVEVEETKGNQMALSSSADFTLKVWRFERAPDTSTPVGHCVRTLSGHEGWINCCRVFQAPLNDIGAPVWKALSGSDDNDLRVWTISGPDSGLCERVLKGHTGVVIACEHYSVDTQSMAVSTSADLSIRLWNLGTGECEFKLDDPGRVRGCDVWVDPETLAVSILTCSADCCLRLWDLSAQHAHQMLQRHTGEVTACQIYDGGDGSKMISAGQDGCMYSWDLANGNMLHKFIEDRSDEGLSGETRKDFAQEKLKAGITGCAVFSVTGEPNRDDGMSVRDTPGRPEVTSSRQMVVCSRNNGGKFFANLMVFDIPPKRGAGPNVELPGQPAHSKVVGPKLMLKGHREAVHGCCAFQRRYERETHSVVISCSEDCTMRVWVSINNGFTDEGQAIEDIKQCKDKLIKAIKDKDEEDRSHLSGQEIQTKKLTDQQELDRLEQEHVDKIKQVARAKKVSEDKIADAEESSYCAATIEIYKEPVLDCCAFKQGGKWKILSCSQDSSLAICDLEHVLKSNAEGGVGKVYRQPRADGRGMKENGRGKGGKGGKGSGKDEDDEDPFCRLGQPRNQDEKLGHTKMVTACCTFGGASAEGIAQIAGDANARHPWIDLIVKTEKAAYTGDMDTNFDEVDVKKKLNGKGKDVGWLRERAKEPTRALSCSADTTLRVWSLRGDHRCLHVLSGHTSPIVACCVHPNGGYWRAVSGSKRTVSASELRVWNLSETDPNCGKELVTGRRVFRLDVSSVAVAIPSFIRGTFPAVVGMVDGRMQLHDLSNSGLHASPHEMWKAMPRMSKKAWAYWAIQCIEETSPHILYQKFGLTFGPSDDRDDFLGQTILHLLSNDEDREKSSYILRSILQRFNNGRRKAIPDKALGDVDSLAEAWAQEVGLEGERLTDREKDKAQTIHMDSQNSVTKAKATIGLVGRAGIAQNDGGTTSLLASACQRQNEEYAELLLDDFAHAMVCDSHSDEVAVTFVSEQDLIQALKCFPDLTEKFLRELPLCTASDLVSRDRHYKFKASEEPWEVLADANRKPVVHGGTMTMHQLMLHQVIGDKKIELNMQGIGAEVIISLVVATGDAARLTGLRLKNDGTQKSAIRIFQEGAKWAVQIVDSQLNDIFVIRKGKLPFRVRHKPGQVYLEDGDKIEQRASVGLRAWLQEIEVGEDKILEYLALDSSQKTHELESLKRLTDVEVEELQDILWRNFQFNTRQLEAFAKRLKMLRQVATDEGHESSNALVVNIVKPRPYFFWDDFVESQYYYEEGSESRTDELLLGFFPNEHARKSQKRRYLDKEASLVRAELLPIIGMSKTASDHGLDERLQVDHAGLTNGGEKQTETESGVKDLNMDLNTVADSGPEQDSNSDEESRDELGDEALRNKLRERGLSTKGKRAMLIKQLDEHAQRQAAVSKYVTKTKKEETGPTEDKGGPLDEDEANVLPFYGILKAAVDHAKTTGTPAIFQAPALKVIVQHKWEHSISLLYRAQSIGYIAHVVQFEGLLIFGELDIGDLEDHDHNGSFGSLHSGAIHVSWLFCVVYSVALAKFELMQMREHVDYFTDLYNYIDITGGILGLGALISLRSDCHSEGEKVMQAFAGLLRGFKVIYYMRGFESTAPLINMLQKVVMGMRSFVAVLLVVIIA